MTNDAYLLLGSNINAPRNLPAAVAMLARFGIIAQTSRVWESPPVDGASQPNYLNGAVLLRTRLCAAELRLSAIASIEEALLRVRNPDDKNASRTIDIDIAFFNRDTTMVEHRRIPDPEVAERAFALRSLADVNPDYVHPDTGLTLREMLLAVPDLGTLRERPDVDLSADL